MITIKEELENYSFSKVFSKFYYSFKSKKSTINNNNNNNNSNNKNNNITNGANIKKSPSLINDDDNLISEITTTTTIKNKPLKDRNINNSKEGIIEEENEELIKERPIVTTPNPCCGYIDNGFKKTKYSLNNINETPEHLKREYILNGYRVDFSYWLSFKSMFIFGHNDFSNIHSHLIPGLYFIYTLWGILVNDDYDIKGISDKIMFGIFLGSATITMICSVLYHTFGCHSLGTYKKLLLCDYLGIIMLIGSSFYPSLFYTYKCNPYLMVFYMSSISLLCTSLCVLIFVPRFQEMHTLRNTLFCATALFGVIPTIHTLFIFESSIVYFFFKRILTMFAIFGMGLFFYIYKLPESFIPNIEHIITSHSIWHIFTCCGPLYHLETCLMLFNLLSNINCINI